MENTYYYGYKITNLINGHLYIGMHQLTLNDHDYKPSVGDTKFPDGYIGSGKLIHEAYKLYGIDQFKLEIIKECNTYEEINKWEREIVNSKFIDRTDTYNIKIGGKKLYNYGDTSKRKTQKHILKSDDDNDIVKTAFNDLKFLRK